MDNKNNSYDFPIELQDISLPNGKTIEKRKAVVRTDTMSTLGIVSNNYGLVKHGSVIDSFREAGKKFDVKEKISLTNNGAHLFYQMTFPKVQAEVKKGDIVRLMMIVKNSYNGANSLQVIFGAFRLVCENGMVLGTKFLSFSYRHIGNVGGINDPKMIEQYKNAYSSYIKLFGERTPIIAEMAKKQISGGDSLFDKKNISLPKYLLNEAQDSFEQEKDRTVWGYYNSLTYAVTHKIKSKNPGVSIEYGKQAWREAERLVN